MYKAKIDIAPDNVTAIKAFLKEAGIKDKSFGKYMPGIIDYLLSECLDSKNIDQIRNIQGYKKAMGY